MSNKITIVILAQNEASNLSYLLPQLDWASVLILDNNSTDETEIVAKKFGARLEKVNGSNFAQLRNQALTLIQTPYIFYLDADERIGLALKEELFSLIDDDNLEVGTLKRQNYFYGEKINFGGWQKDYVTRVFKKEALLKWQGEIHESPQYCGSEIVLKSPLYHLTHRCTADNLKKSRVWTQQEAHLLHQADQTPVTAGIIMRKTLMEFWRRYIRDQGYRDGRVGFVEALVQAFNRALVYIQVWELQQEPAIAGKYQLLEQELIKPK